MLKIDLVNKEKYYVMKENLKPYNSPLPPIPKLPVQGKIPFHKWYEQNADKIEKIVDEFINIIIEITSENYVATFNLQNIKKEFIEIMYKTSSNSDKGYM